MDLIFIIVSLLHIIIWIFVLLAFVNAKTAYINLYYIIPLIYISHLLPFHTLSELKRILNPEKCKKDNKDFEDNTIIVSMFKKIKKILKKNCFRNPFSIQGMLIFGAITSAYRIKRNFIYK
jgi:hypothetical protein